MNYSYPDKVVRDFIEDYKESWNVTLPKEDAVLMMSLFDGLSALFVKYEADCDDDGWSLITHPLIRR